MRRAIVILTVTAVLALLGSLAARQPFLRAIGSVIVGRQGPFKGEAPSAGPELAKLPLIEFPAQGSGEALMVLYSGNGAWAKAVSGIARAAAAEGLPTVGFDCLRYFWTRRTPPEAAADLTRVIARYRAVWGRDEVVLAGYSFGAEALPALWPYLPAETRAHVRAMVLLGPSNTMEMVVRPWSWLNIDGAGAVPLKPLVARVVGPKVTCIYGAADRVAECAHILPPAELVTLPGGHHFNRDYPAVARAVLKAAGVR
jgi:type IV secretory pathway VirJ component